MRTFERHVVTVSFVGACPIRRGGISVVPKAPDEEDVQPLDAELWSLVRAAVQAAGAAADAHLESGGYRPRFAMPTVGVFDSGWPNLDRSRLFPADDAPTDFSALFGPRSDQLKPLAYADVPELVAVVDYARARDELRQRLTVPSATGRSDIEDRILELEAVDLPLSILDRSRAVGADDDGALLALYIQRERAWRLDPLPVEYVIPLALTALDLDEALALDDTTRIEPLDPATQAARAPTTMSVASVPGPVVSAATHAIVIAGRMLANPGPGPRLFGRADEPFPLDSADVVCQVLRILSHVDVGYAQVLLRPIGWTDHWHHDLPPISTLTTVRRYPERFDDYGWLRARNPIPRATLQQAPQVMTSLRDAPHNVQLAARRLSLAAMREFDEDRTVDACIGLEALLGEGRDELSHRLALRAATALATRPKEPADAQTIYDLVKRVYAHRSAVVHGTPGDKSRTLTIGDKKWPAAEVAVVLLRDVLGDLLSRDLSWTPKALDATLLAALNAEDRDPGHVGGTDTQD